jgi:hypothetical protein
MKHALAALVIAPFLLSGCVETLPVPVDQGGDCGAADLQYLVGKPGVLLDGMRFSQDVRVVQHDMAVTLDFNPDRLNFWLDRRDVIERVSCG